MELAEIRLFEPQMAEIDLFTMPDAVGVGEPSARKVKPYISGHVTDGSTFTFQVNGSDVSVSVDANGNWKYEPTATITSLAFVGVPELDSLTLCKINGLQTFNLDYPIVPVFKGCDSTTQNALEYVYHIRGTATDNFQFTLKYIDDNDTVTTVTESAVIDGDGKWDVAYSGKWIYAIQSAYQTIDNNNTWRTKPTAIEFTETLDKLSTFNDADIGQNFRGIFCNMQNLQSIKFAEGTTFKGVARGYNMFSNTKLVELDLSTATFENANNGISAIINSVSTLKTLNINKIKTSVLIQSSLSMFVYGCTGLENLFVPQDSSLGNDIVLSDSPLSYDSMLRVVGWLKDLTDLTTQTVTFKKATYDALTAEQKATLEGIIVIQKHWNLATA